MLHKLFKSRKTACISGVGILCASVFGFSALNYYGTLVLPWVGLPCFILGLLFSALGITFALVPMLCNDKDWTDFKTFITGD